jgi:hypothetical protein
MMFWIRGRRLWGAKRARSVTRADWTDGVTIIVHHTADAGPKANTPKAERAFMRQVQDFHMGPARGWSDIAYNYIVMPSGRVYEARGYGVVGAHAPGWNTNGIGVCFAGTYTDRIPSAASVKAYNQLLNRLAGKGAKIQGEKAHGDVYATGCPGSGIRKALKL